jgi:hypothetical protein
MKTIIGLLFISVIVITGCTSVTSVNQLGMQPVKLDPKKWEGLWIHKDGMPFYIKIKDSKKGILRIAYVEHKKGDFQIYKFDAFVKQGEDSKFCNILVKDIVPKDEDELKDQEYADSFYWMLIENKDNQIIIFLPDDDKIKKLIEDGKLKGVKKKNALILQGTSKEITKFVESHKNGELFHWKEPMVLRRAIKK